MSAEQSFKRAFTLTKKVSDPIAKGVIETQLDRIQNMKREGSEMAPVIVSYFTAYKLQVLDHQIHQFFRILKKRMLAIQHISHQFQYLLSRLHPSCPIPVLYDHLNSLTRQSTWMKKLTQSLWNQKRRYRWKNPRNRSHIHRWHRRKSQFSRQLRQNRLFPTQSRKHQLLNHQKLQQLHRQRPLLHPRNRQSP